MHQGNSNDRADAGGHGSIRADSGKNDDAHEEDNDELKVSHPQERAFICALTKEVVITGASRMNALLCQRYMERYENGRPPAGKTDARPPYRKGDTPRARVYHGCVCSHLRFLYSVFS